MYVKYVSPSRMKTFIDCSFKYFLTYECYVCQECYEYTFVSELLNLGIDISKNKVCLNPECGSTKLSKLELPTNFGAVNGSIQHRVLELYAHARKEKKNDWRLQWQKNLIDGYMGKLDGIDYDNKMIMELMFQKNQAFALGDMDCGACHKKYGAKCDDSILHNRCPYKTIETNINLMQPIVSKYDESYESCLGIEKKFDIQLTDEVKVVGVLDLVLDSGNKTVEVVDYKSGSWCMNYKQLQDDLQARVYSFAIKEEFPDYDCHLLTFDYFQRRPVTVAFSEYDDNKTKIKTIKTFHNIKNTNKPTRIPLKRDGNLNWYCKGLCSREICDQVWRIFRKRYGGSGL